MLHDVDNEAFRHVIQDQFVVSIIELYKLCPVEKSMFFHFEVNEKRLAVFAKMTSICDQFVT